METLTADQFKEVKKDMVIFQYWIDQNRTEWGKILKVNGWNRWIVDIDLKKAYDYYTKYNVSTALDLREAAYYCRFANIDTIDQYMELSDAIKRNTGGNS